MGGPVDVGEHWLNYNKYLPTIDDKMFNFSYLLFRLLLYPKGAYRTCRRNCCLRYFLSIFSLRIFNLRISCVWFKTTTTKGKPPPPYAPDFRLKNELTKIGYFAG